MRVRRDTPTFGNLRDRQPVADHRRCSATPPSSKEAKDQLCKHSRNIVRHPNPKSSISRGTTRTLEPLAQGLNWTTARLQGECSTTELARVDEIARELSRSLRRRRVANAPTATPAGRRPGSGMRSAMLLSGLTTMVSAITAFRGVAIRLERPGRRVAPAGDVGELFERTVLTVIVDRRSVFLRPAPVGQLTRSTCR